MITWNRFHYAKRTIDNLLATNDDFRLYWWDNGSSDGVAEYISALEDPRIVLRHKHDSNVMQAVPTRWFLEQSKADVIGKIDDDTLVPDGWIKTIRPAVERHDRLGMVGCWTFWPEDFERNAGVAQKKIRGFDPHRVLSNLGIGGTAFLMKKSLALKYLIKSHNGTAFPIDRAKMSAEGYCSGWYYPLIWAEHMDDPRSEYCLGYDESSGGMSALSAKVRGFKTQQEFLNWIKTDADRILDADTSVQIKKYKFDNSILGRVMRRLRR
ncbi:glycosyltransferase family 2 protein [Methylococcus sp. EFPC2]|uniref:glycosyltransferase family 2 protein n=1 Tax=Methylococcus sp. EFPC2 TaxID=2812648 RepID=UPI0019689840|nr:glycosyltransferase [Methylococcus sp. EFPC2]QSA97288.1 glycosyltransferase [Methylococcus sp. EFPC2]